MSTFAVVLIYSLIGAGVVIGGVVNKWPVLGIAFAGLYWPVLVGLIIARHPSVQ